MQFRVGSRGATFRGVRRADHAVPERPPRPARGTGALEVRVWAARGAETLLLATASRKQGGAVERNRFRRRVRHALLQLLAEGVVPAAPVVVWARPGRGAQTAGRIPFTDILGQLRLALTSRGGA